MSDAMIYNPSVATNDITMLRKIEFVNRSENVNGPSDLAKFSMPLKAKKNAAIWDSDRCSILREIFQISYADIPSYKQ